MPAYVRCAHCHRISENDAAEWVMYENIYRYVCKECLTQATPSSAAEETESSPPFGWPEWFRRWQIETQAEVSLHQNQIAELEERLAALEAWRETRRLTEMLEAGQQSPPTMERPMKDSPSDAEPCQHKLSLELTNCPKGWAWCLQCKNYVPWVGRQQGSTAPPTPPSSPSVQPTTPTLHVEPGCECVPRELYLIRSRPQEWQIRCQKCAACWLHVLTPALGAPAKASEST
jgi:hypothetical protein